MRFLDFMRGKLVRRFWVRSRFVRLFKGLEHMNFLSMFLLSDNFFIPTSLDSVESLTL